MIEGTSTPTTTQKAADLKTPSPLDSTGKDEKRTGEKAQDELNAQAQMGELTAASAGTAAGQTVVPVETIKEGGGRQQPAPLHPDRAQDMSPPTPQEMIEDENDELDDKEYLKELARRTLRERLAAQRKSLQRARSAWSISHLALFYFSTFFSLAAAFILSSDFLKASSVWSKVSAGLAFVATILIILSVIVKESKQVMLTIFAIVSVTTAALVLKLETSVGETIPHRDYLVGLEIMAGALMAIYAVIRNRKPWVKSQQFLTDVEKLDLDTVSQDVGPSVISKEFKKIIDEYNKKRS